MDKPGHNSAASPGYETRDANVRVVVLRGLPGMFCSGADLKFVRDGGIDCDLGYLAPGAVRGGLYQLNSLLS